MEDSPHIDIDYVTHLARIELSVEEKAKLSRQLEDILGYFKKLDIVDVENIEPMAHAQKVRNIWREGDLPGKNFKPEVLTQMAPDSRDDQVVVPKVVVD